ncbi:MAG: c-type cytochrome [Magnetococcales bacterium]|nr:c-type cytochrome [Magnetococcales bacterium]
MRGNKDFFVVFITVAGVLGFVVLLHFFAEESPLASRTAPVAAMTGLVDQGRRIARNCSPCHDMTSTRKLTQVGPPLWGIVGKGAGAVPGYKYSQAHASAGQSGVVWNESSLNRYLDNPKEFIPGNKMAFAGLHDDVERKALIEYLKTLQEPKDAG